MNKNIDEFEKMVKPLIKYMNDETKFHPHMKIIITSTGAELVEGVMFINTLEYIKD